MSNDMRCPDCGGELHHVRNTGGYLNDDQFDSIRAGDWYCEACKGTRAATGYRYFWNREIVPPSSAPLAADADTGRDMSDDDVTYLDAECFCSPPEHQCRYHDALASLTTLRAAVREYAEAHDAFYGLKRGAQRSTMDAKLAALRALSQEPT